jgi:hypothetical protein
MNAPSPGATITTSGVAALLRAMNTGAVPGSVPESWVPAPPDDEKV